jgi:chaperonin GroEL
MLCLLISQVGGSSEVEVNEKKDRITDALNATRAAVAEGIVAGGGVALLRASKHLAAVRDSCENLDQKIGVDIVMKALRVPCATIAKNAGEEGAVIVGKLLESDDDNFGFNAYNGQYMNMVKAGIVDPTKVVRTALVDAASVSGLMITTEAMIADLPQEEPAPPMGGMPGMGGM